MTAEIERLKAIILRRNAQIDRLVTAMNSISEVVATAVVLDKWIKQEVEEYLEEVLARIDALAVYEEEDIVVVRQDLYPDLFEEKCA